MVRSQLEKTTALIQINFRLKQILSSAAWTFFLSGNIIPYNTIWTKFEDKVRVMMFNATFNNISAISWWSVLLREETGVPGENHRPVASHWQTWSHNVVSSTPCLSGIRTHNFSSDRHWVIVSCKSNYQTITTTTAQKRYRNNEHDQ